MPDTLPIAMEQDVTAVAVEQPVPEPLPLPEVRVRVRQGPPISITTTPRSIVPPNVGPLVPFMPEAAQKVINARGSRYYRNNYPVDSYISTYPHIATLQQWADAIARYGVLKLSGQMDDAEAVVRDPLENGYLAAGGQLYKVNLVQSLPMTKALAAVRKQVREQYVAVAKIQAEQIVAAAERFAADMRRNVTALVNDAKAMQAKAAEALKKAGKESLPAQQIIEMGWPLKYARHCSVSVEAVWHIGIPISFCPKHGQYGSLELPLAEADPVPVLLWQPYNVADGSFTVTNIHIDGSFEGELPHSHHTGSCMKPLGLPLRLLTAEDVLQLQMAVQNCISGGINFGSLYSNARQWNKDVQKFLPTRLKTIQLSAGRDRLMVEWADELMQQQQAARPAVQAAEGTDEWHL